jgi:hypothetical protein
MPSASGWGWFGAWTVVGALVTFSFLTGFSIGLFVLPVAVLAVWVVGSRSPSRSAAFGLISGAGFMCLVVWLLHRGDVPCPEDGSLSGVPGQESVGCGGMDAQPWLVAAIVLVLAGVLAFAAAHRQDRRSALG